MANRLKALIVSGWAITILAFALAGHILSAFVLIFILLVVDDNWEDYNDRENKFDKR